MGICVHTVQAHHAGFGAFELSEGTTYDEYDSIQEYLCDVSNRTDLVLVCGGDDDYDQVSSASGATHNQNGGTIIGWRHPDGLITLECVYEVTEGTAIGWVACDYTDGDRLRDVRHGAVRTSSSEAIADARQGAYEGVRYAHSDGYLYVDRPEAD